MPDIKQTPVVTDNPDSESETAKDALHYAQRGIEISDGSLSDGIDGFDAQRMRDRTLLSTDEEKKLLRKIDWRIMTICSILFLIKNIDSDNISNARIMNKGTETNMMTQLKMTSDEYNLLTVLYYVSILLHWSNKYNLLIQQ